MNTIDDTVTTAAFLMIAAIAATDTTKRKVVKKCPRLLADSDPPVPQITFEQTGESSGAKRGKQRET